MKLVVALLYSFLLTAAGYADAIDRIAMGRLRATHQQVVKNRAALRPVNLESGYGDVRAILHAHSYWSHDSNGSIPEITKAARESEVNVIMFSNHPADSYDYFADTETGMHDGVLLIPGAEIGGLLAYPTQSISGRPENPPQRYVDRLHATGGLSFVSHLEERLDWNLQRLTGTEIYNTHFDLMDEDRFLKLFRNPLALVQIMPALQQYPQETFASIQDYPATYLQTWDRWCQQAPHTGIAANDAHHNQAYRAIVTDNGELRVEDALGEVITTIHPDAFPAIKTLVGDAEAGETILEIDLDPYERSFRHVSTHLLINEVSQPQVWEALRAGRAYVAFDWMADPTGFTFLASQQAADAGLGQMWPMGSQVDLVSGMQLQAEAPLSVDWKLIRDGQPVRDSSGREFQHDVTEPGVYRIEAWLEFAGEPRVWILSNPIYVQAWAS